MINTNSPCIWSTYVHIKIDFLSIMLNKVYVNPDDFRAGSYVTLGIRDAQHISTCHWDDRSMPNIIAFDLLIQKIFEEIPLFGPFLGVGHL